MQTTVEISDHRLARLREAARRDNTTMRDLIEEGLELALEAREKETDYVAEPVVFGGNGLAADLDTG